MMVLMRKNPLDDVASSQKCYVLECPSENIELAIANSPMTIRTPRNIIL
jgi:hypothetical protein